jgi:hypothetical protein
MFPCVQQQHPTSSLTSIYMDMNELQTDAFTYWSWLALLRLSDVRLQTVKLCLTRRHAQAAISLIIADQAITHC